MTEPYKELEDHDPTDSMKRTVELVRGLIDRSKDMEGKHLDDALALISRKEEEAYRYFMRPLDDDEIYHRLIDIHSERGDRELLDRYMSMADQRLARRWMLEGECQAVMGNHTRAAESLKRALFYGPRNDIVEQVESELQRAQKRVRKANDKVDTLIEKRKREPGSITVLSELGKYLLDLDLLEEAEEVNERLLEEEGGNSDGLFRKGSLRFLRGDIEGAKVVFEKLKEENPGSTKVRSALNWSIEMENRDRINVR